MTEFGETLRKAREAKGLTIAQISDVTNMLPQQIEDLENENFSRIAAPIYGRGFVKLYCSVVGLDPKPLVQEFMDIYNGNKQPTIKFKKTVRNAEPIARQAPQQFAQEPDDGATMPTRGDDGFSAIRRAAEPPPPTPPPPPAPPAPPPPPPAQEPEPAPEQEYEVTMPPVDVTMPYGGENTMPESYDEPTIAAIHEEVTMPPPSDEPTTTRSDAVTMPPPPPPRSEESAPLTAAQAMRRAVEAQPFRLEQETIRAPEPPSGFGPSRYSTPMPDLKPDSRYSDFYIPPIVWRIAIVIAGICLVGWLLFALGSKVWRAATSAPEETPAAETLPGAPQTPQKPNESAVSSPSEPAKPRPERTPMKLPPLYFE